MASCIPPLEIGGPLLSSNVHQVRQQKVLRLQNDSKDLREKSPRPSSGKKMLPPKLKLETKNPSIPPKSTESDGVNIVIESVLRHNSESSLEKLLEEWSTCDSVLLNPLERSKTLHNPDENGQLFTGDVYQVVHPSELAARCQAVEVPSSEEKRMNFIASASKMSGDQTLSQINLDQAPTSNDVSPQDGALNLCQAESNSLIDVTISENIDINFIMDEMNTFDIMSCITEDSSDFSVWEDSNAVDDFDFMGLIHEDDGIEVESPLPRPRGRPRKNPINLSKRSRGRPPAKPTPIEELPITGDPDIDSYRRMRILNTFANRRCRENRKRKFETLESEYERELRRNNELKLELESVTGLLERLRSKLGLEVKEEKKSTVLV